MLLALVWMNIRIYDKNMNHLIIKLLKTMTITQKKKKYLKQFVWVHSIDANEIYFSVMLTLISENAHSKNDVEIIYSAWAWLLLVSCINPTLFMLSDWRCVSVLCTRVCACVCVLLPCLDQFSQFCMISSVHQNV